MRYLLILLFCLISFIGFSQSTLPLRADTVLVEKTGGNGELKIKNSTRDSLGILVNMGGGRTRFVRFRQITDSSFIIPPGGIGDTIVIRGTSGDLQAVTDRGNKTTDTIIANGIRTPVLLPDTTNEPDFEFIILPDLQGMTNTYHAALRSIGQWIVDNKIAENIKAVLSVGDLTDFAQTGEFTRVDSLFDRFDSLQLPNLPLIGNHDYNTGDIVAGNRTATQWHTRFGPARFVGLPWYGSQMGDSTQNYYIKFDVGSYKFLVIGLEFIPRDTALRWAQKVIDSFPDRRVIINTHAYITAAGERSKDSSAWSNSFYGLDADNNGQDVWEKLVRKNPRIMTVFSGHFHYGDSVGLLKRITQAGDHGNAVHQLMVNYQLVGGGDGGLHYNNGRGYIMKFRISPANSKAYISVYSPFLNQYYPLQDSFYIEQPSIKVDGALSIRNGLYSRGEGFFDSSLYVAKVGKNRIVYTQENGRLDSIPYQTANTVLSGPSTGSPANPTFRTLVLSDIPSLSTLYIQNQSLSDQVASFRISGVGIIGTDIASTAKIRVNNGSNGVTSAFGPLLSNSINNTYHSIDTVTAANLASLKPRLLQGQRDVRFLDNGLTLENSSNSLWGMVYRVRSNVTLTNTNGDRNGGIQGVLYLRQYGGFSGLTTVNGPTVPGQALAGLIGTVDIANAGGGGNIITAKGYTSSINAVLNLSVADTLANHIFFNSGLGAILGKLKKVTHLYIPNVTADTSYAVLQTGAIDSNIFYGPTRYLNLSTQEAALASHSITSITALGSTSGGLLNLYAKDLPTAANQRLGAINFGTRNGASAENFGVTLDAFTNAAWTDGSAEQAYARLLTNSSGTQNEVMRWTANARVGIGAVTNPGARVQIAAGFASAGGAPLMFTPGTNLTSPAAGAEEYDGTSRFFTPGSTRLRYVLTNNAIPSNGQLPIGNGTDFTLATITGSSSVSVSNGAGSITLSVPTTYITSADFSPSTFLTTNVTSATVNKARYQRTGNIITFSVNITADPTAAGLVEVGISFPSGIDNIAAANDVSGTANTIDVAGENGEVIGDLTNNRFLLRFTAIGVGARTYSISGQYTYTAP